MLQYTTTKCNNNNNKEIWFCKQGGILFLDLTKSTLWPLTVKRDKGGYCKNIKGSIHQEDTMIIDLYTLKVRIPNFIKQIILVLKEDSL
jgi:hypothetical protein